MNHHQSWIKWLQFLLAIVIALGICFRFVNLDQKPYWHDETFTSLRVSGYRLAEATEQLYNEQEIRIADLQQYQRPSSDQSAIATIKGLATEEPQHPPLYYVMAQFWAQWFGSSVIAMRSLPAIISLLAFPVIYWLCLELFGVALIGWMAVALFSISPIYVRYAQEARQYSLWIVLILLSCIAILKATRRNTGLNWGIYTLTAIAGLYCHLLTVFVLLGHGLYVFVVERFRFSRNFTFYLLSCFISGIALLPWIWIIKANQTAFAMTTDWMKQPVSILFLLQHWGVYLCQLFVSWHFQYNHLLAYLAFPVLIFIIFAVYSLCHQTPRRTWVLILTLVGVTAFALILPDLVLGGKRSTNPRYLLPCYLGLHLAIAYLLTTQLLQAQRSIARSRLWRMVTVLILSAGFFTCSFNAQATTWWGWSEFDVEVSRIIHQSPQPLVISEMPFGMITPLSYRLDPDTKLMLIANPDSLKIPTNYDRDVFVYNPSDRLQSQLKQQGFQTELIYQFRDGSFTLALHRLSILQAKIATT
uniref:Glycosyltransferase RgtA/B/C/D-like domain-containing protein n=1 Tax=Oscillatoriales cyanobacterium SpSt-402 TaxID=2282168 RepID=A0A832M218_9CYAN